MAVVAFLSLELGCRAVSLWEVSAALDSGGLAVGVWEAARGGHGLDVEVLVLLGGRCPDLSSGQSWQVPFLSLLAEPRVSSW